MKRLTSEQVYSEMLRLDPTQPGRLLFKDFEGHEVELTVSDAEDAPQVAEADDIPEEFRIRRIEGIRSYVDPGELWPFAEHLGFETAGDHFELRGETRSARWYFSEPPERPFDEIAVGVWHHVAFDAGGELEAWREYANGGPVPFTKIYDHYFFDSCYAPSPGGTVELTSRGPGFLIDQRLEELGEELALSPWVEPPRAKLERGLTPIVNPRPRGGKRRAAEGFGPADA